jgi:hypothetical protein
MQNAIRTASVAFVALVGVGSQVYAGTMGNGAQQRNMVAVRKCLAMPHDQMMTDQGCKSMMAVHPELFPGGTVMPPTSTHH